ncbi:MAG: hydantoinase/oxoprolinase family protein [Acidobacteriota bacterium]|nr:MAG: hydantoinase/oxoprolinase family protein [Acidobacteriota bacterium]
MLRIGIDTGGTFTDFVVLDGDKLTVFKLPSTPGQPEKAVLEGIARIVEGRDEFLIQHGSTVATNAFLERKGAQCVLVTNQGFEDILEIGRQNRPGLFSLESSRPKALIPSRHRIGVKERTDWEGKAITPLEAKSLDWVKGKVAQLNPESIAVVLLYSYLNPANELAIGDALKELGVPISLSHQILPEFREYERTSTTAINAYVRPIMSRYLTALQASPQVPEGKLAIMQSNGGSISAESASREPVRTLFSGPAGGVVGAFELSRIAGYEKVLTIDMGGTSTDVCLCNKRIETTHEASIDHHPVSIQMIDIHTLGAGGGSIAWVDEGGLLKVGPHSAGADPGPICYGKGTDVTVTDANVFLGRMNPDYFLGGEMPLSPEKIGAGLEELGKELGKSSETTMSAEEVAEGVIEIVNIQMERALRVISLEKGYDTREFTLVTFGGAGGLHACDLARSLLIPRVIVPPSPGALSAFGILRSDVVQDASVTSVISTSDPEWRSALQNHLQKLDEEVIRKMAEHGFEDGQVELEASVDARYLGQSYELNTPYSKNVTDEFHTKHEQVYGYANRTLPVEFVNIRMRGRARYPLPPIPKTQATDENPVPEALVLERPVIHRGKPEPTRFYLRNQLKAGNRIQGPAVILEYSATTFIPADFSATIDPWLNIVIEPVS